MWPEKQQVQYLKTAVGCAVQTSDGQRIGVVSEIRGEYFKINAGRWHRDYWLRSDCLRSVVPGEVVVLSVDKAGLDDTKIADVPPRD
jgi:hypothetical protein